MNMKRLIVLAVLSACSAASAFGPSDEDREKMKQHRALCERHLKSICGKDIEFPDPDHFTPGPGVFKKIEKIQNCVESDAVQKSDIPAKCKATLGPDRD